MSNTDELTPAQARALMDELEKEKQKRAAERVASGETVEVLLTVFSEQSEPTPEEIEQAKREAWERHIRRHPQDHGRVPLFDPTIVFSWSVRPDPDETNHFLGALLEDAPAQKGDPAEKAPAILGVLGNLDEPAWQSITTQVRPSDGNDPGEIAVGAWRLYQGSLEVRFEDGRVVSRALTGEDPERAAKAMLREDAPEEIVFPSKSWH